MNIVMDCTVQPLSHTSCFYFLEWCPLCQGIYSVLSPTFSFWRVSFIHILLNLQACVLPLNPLSTVTMLIRSSACMKLLKYNSWSCHGTFSRLLFYSFYESRHNNTSIFGVSLANYVALELWLSLSWLLL